MTTTPTPTDTVTITRADPVALQKTADRAMAMVEGFQITDASTYELGAEELGTIKTKLAQLDDQRKGITRPLDEAKTAVMSLFRGPVDMLTRAEQILKGKLLAYQQEQQRIANAARVKAEQLAQEQRDKLAREAAELAAAGKTGEAHVTEQIAAMVVAAPTPVAAAPKVAGLSTKTTVAFEVVDKLALIKHVAAHPELASLLVEDTVRLRAYVRGLGMACQLDGVRVFEQSTMSSGRR